jgi:hypothetical protein
MSAPTRSIKILAENSLLHIFIFSKAILCGMSLKLALQSVDVVLEAVQH